MGLLGAGSSPESKQIAAGSDVKDEDVLDQVLINESNEAKQSN